MDAVFADPEQIHGAEWDPDGGHVQVTSPAKAARATREAGWRTHRQYDRKSNDGHAMRSYRIMVGDE